MKPIRNPLHSHNSTILSDGSIPLGFHQLEYPWVTDALIDWCEENFKVVWFIAEFFNTTSNIIFIYLSVLGFLACRKYNYPLRFYLSFLSLGVVGVGSALFHGSLTYWTQLLDEVPMIWGSGVFLYSCFQIQKHKSYGNWLTVLLVGYCVWVTVTYLLNRDDDFFQTAYGLMAGTITIKSFHNFYLLYSLANTLSSKTASNESSPKKSGTPTIRTQILTPALCLLLTSFFSYGTGFVFWILDNVFCHSHLIPYKQSLGNISWLLEFHAFWHIGTGWGTYCCIVFTAWCWFWLSLAGPQLQKAQETKTKTGIVNVKLGWTGIGGWVPVVVVENTSSDQDKEDPKQGHQDKMGTKNEEVISPVAKTTEVEPKKRRVATRSSSRRTKKE